MSNENLEQTEEHRVISQGNSRSNEGLFKIATLGSFGLGLAFMIGSHLTGNDYSQGFGGGLFTGALLANIAYYCSR